MTSMKKLNLGCGYPVKESIDWINIDSYDYGYNIIADILEGLPLEDHSIDFVMMNHVLQMFHYDQLYLVFKELKRVMKSDATLRILTPDLEKAVAALERGDLEYFPIADKLESSLYGKFARYIFWHGDTRCAFNIDSMRDLLHKNGFTMKESGVEFGQCELDSREVESLVIECQPFSD
jgi:SAM-dependent methyltransferase